MFQYRRAVGSCLPRSGIWSSSLLWSSDQCLPSSWQDARLTLVFHLGMTAAFADHMFTASVWLINIPQLGHPRLEGTLEPFILNNQRDCLSGLLEEVVPNIHSPSAG